MKILLLALSLVAGAVLAAPTESEKQQIQDIVSYSGQTLGGLLECDEHALHSQYRAALSDAMFAYPETDPVKVRALLRKIDRQAEVVSTMGIKKIPNPQPDVIEAHQTVCRHNTLTAKENLQHLDAFILNWMP